MYQTDVVIHSVGKVWSTILRKNDAIGQIAKGQSVVICIVNNRQDVAINQKIYFIYNGEQDVREAYA